jgi:hypothetical protein
MPPQTARRGIQYASHNKYDSLHDQIHRTEIPSSRSIEGKGKTEKEKNTNSPMESATKPSKSNTSLQRYRILPNRFISASNHDDKWQKGMIRPDQRNTTAMNPLGKQTGRSRQVAHAAQTSRLKSHPKARFLARALKFDDHCQREEE